MPNKLLRNANYLTKLSRRLRLRHLALTAPGLYLLSLVPLLLLARYNMASADDFGYSAATHAAWSNGGGLWGVLVAAAHESVETWQAWQGSFSAIFLMALQPGIFGNAAYALTTWLMLAALSAGVLLLFRAVFGRIFGMRWPGRLLAGLWVLFFAVQAPPSALQGFFWYNGAVYYTFIFALALLMLALLVFCLHAHNSGQKGRQCVLLTGACLLGIFTGGGNYVTALQCLLALSLWLLALVCKKNRAWRLLLPPLLVHAGAFALSAAAPGNAVRAATLAPPLSAPQAVLGALAAGIECAEQWLNLPLLAALLLLAPILWRGVGPGPISEPQLSNEANNAFTFRFPALVSAASYAFWAAGFCPPLYAMGNLGDGRLLNIQYYLFLLLLVFNLFYWLGWLKKKTALYTRNDISLNDTILQFLHRLALPGLVGLTLLFALLLVGGGTYRQLTAYSAVRSLAAGEAAEYGRQMRARVALIESSEAAVVAVPQLTVRPRELFFADLNPDASYFSNVIMAEYYGKERIELAVPPS